MKGKQVIQKEESVLYQEINKLQGRLKQENGAVDSELVHDIRVICKRVRAECTLLKSESERDSLKTLSKELSAYLSPVRDAEVMLDTFDCSLTDQEKVDFEALRARLERVLSEISIDTVLLRGKVKRLKKRVKQLKRINFSASLSQSVIKKAEARSRKKYNCLNTAIPDTYHDWRKAVKAYLYLLKLEPQDRSQLSLIKALAENLGLLHDLHVFMDTITEQHVVFKEPLSQILIRREKELLSEIHKLARELYGQ
ncbi:MAG: CHAD domain-containing protein [Neptuniibacter sp.]